MRIKFFYVSTEDIASHTSINKNRLHTAETIDDIRSYHSFRPNGETKLELYTLSADEICVVKNLRLSENWSLCGSSQWYPSLILEINWDQRDLLVKSMHNSGYDKNCFFWSPRDDRSYVPFTHIGLTEVPNIIGRHGQNSYKISAKLFELFNQNLSKLLNRKQ